MALEAAMREARWAVLGGGAIALALLAWIGARGSHLVGGAGWPEYVLFGIVVLGLLGIAHTVLDIDHRHRRLEKLRGAILISAGLGTALPRPAGVASTAASAGDEIDRLQQAVAGLIGRERDRRGALDRRLESVLGAIDDAIVVATAQGQASLVNAAGKALLGGESSLGRSLFEVFERESLAFAMTLAESEGPPRRIMLRAVDGREIEASVAGLGVGGGALLRFAAASDGAQRLLEHDLGLHDLAPPAARPEADTLLAELPAVSLDTETTGLDVRRDRLLALGAVRLHGARVYAAETFDRLINPARRIPPASTAIHGITDAMVAAAPSFAGIAADLAEFCGARIWIGHNIGFDAAILRREAALAGIAWEEPVALDTLRLFAALRPRAPDVELDAVAVELGVDVIGRHTALGDALVTAEVYRRLLPLLAEAGVTTLQAALEFAERPRMIRRLQQSLGW
jgi:DNA polymerase-3 subunit epsilon